MQWLYNILRTSFLSRSHTPGFHNRCQKTPFQLKKIAPNPHLHIAATLNKSFSSGWSHLNRKFLYTSIWNILEDKPSHFSCPRGTKQQGIKEKYHALLPTFADVRWKRGTFVVYILQVVAGSSTWTQKAKVNCENAKNLVWSTYVPNMGKVASE